MIEGLNKTKWNFLFQLFTIAPISIFLSAFCKDLVLEE